MQRTPETPAADIDYSAYPDAHGRFGPYGGVYVAETLMAPLAELTDAYLRLSRDRAFIAELELDL
jgi:tryptophan synthase beta chain